MEIDKNKKRALLCAGGTGGHLFPAHALASELIRRGFDVHLVSDERIERYAADFPASVRHKVPSATFAGRNPLKLAKAVLSLGKGYLAGRRLISKTKPDVVVGFGGYPTVPPVMAAATKGVPTMIHEANAVLGRANWLLSNKVKAVALGLPLSSRMMRQTIYTGNPVRDTVLDAAKNTYKAPESDGDFHLTVFGGSQGAQFFSAVVLKAIGLLDDSSRGRLKIVQQARAEDEQAVRSAYDVMDVRADVATFFDDMPSRIADSHLVICRSGASTTAELAVIGRPAILVPYPHALDHDQAANAASLVESGGGWMKKQSEMTPEWLAVELIRLMGNQSILTDVAAKAKAQGRPDAAQRLANAAVALASGQKLDQNVVEEV
ncbi:MAG: undecaprenyldiphospho-muramoylpentapeptide beta-N-acetylglucosaminyltransferase [Hyphomicrobiales bacterium]